MVSRAGLHTTGSPGSAPPVSTGHSRKRAHTAPTVWVECLFVDPIGDIAVLGRPDEQELSEEADRYEELCNQVAVLSISDAQSEGTARLLSR